MKRELFTVFLVVVWLLVAGVGLAQVPRGHGQAMHSRHGMRGGCPMAHMPTSPAQVDPKMMRERARLMRQMADELESMAEKLESGKVTTEEWQTFRQKMRQLRQEMQNLWHKYHQN